MLLNFDIGRHLTIAKYHPCGNDSHRCRNRNHRLRLPQKQIKMIKGRYRYRVEKQKRNYKQTKKRYNYKKTLYGNSDIRDYNYNQHYWTNNVNNTTTVKVFSDPYGLRGSEHRLDKQLIDLPVTFNDEELSTIVFKECA